MAKHLELGIASPPPTAEKLAREREVAARLMARKAADDGRLGLGTSTRDRVRKGLCLVWEIAIAATGIVIATAPMLMIALDDGTEVMRVALMPAQQVVLFTPLMIALVLGYSAIRLRRLRAAVCDERAARRAAKLLHTTGTMGEKLRRLRAEGVSILIKDVPPCRWGWMIKR